MLKKILLLIALIAQSTLAFANIDKSNNAFTRSERKLVQKITSLDRFASSNSSLMYQNLLYNDADSIQYHETLLALETEEFGTNFLAKASFDLETIDLNNPDFVFIPDTHSLAAPKKFAKQVLQRIDNPVFVMEMLKLKDMDEIRRYWKGLLTTEDLEKNIWSTSDYKWFDFAMFLELINFCKENKIRILPGSIEGFHWSQLQQRELGLLNRVKKDRKDNLDSTYVFFMGGAHYWGKTNILGLIKSEYPDLTSIAFKNTIRLTAYFKALFTYGKTFDERKLYKLESKNKNHTAYMQFGENRLAGHRKVFLGSNAYNGTLGNHDDFLDIGNKLHDIISEISSDILSLGDFSNSSFRKFNSEFKKLRSFVRKSEIVFQPELEKLISKVFSPKEIKLIRTRGKNLLLRNLKGYPRKKKSPKLFLNTNSNDPT